MSIVIGAVSELQPGHKLCQDQLKILQEVELEVHGGLVDEEDNHNLNQVEAVVLTVANGDQDRAEDL